MENASERKEIFCNCNKANLKNRRRKLDKKFTQKWLKIAKGKESKFYGKKIKNIILNEQNCIFAQAID